MKKRFLSLIFGALISFTLAAQATDSVPEMKLSLAQAREYALKNNRTLQNASLSVRQAYAARWQTIATMLPQVDGKLDYMNMCGYKMEFGKGMPSISMPPNGTISITAALALNGQMIMGALINNTAIEMQDINKKKTELDIISNVESYYTTILAMEETVGLLNESLASLEKLHDITINSVKVGAAEQTTADQIMVQVASMRSAVNSTERSLEMIYNALALQLATGTDVKLVLTEKLDDVLNVEAALELLKSDFDLTGNYDYQLAEKNVEMSKKNVTLAGMAYVPTLSVFYQYSAKKYFSNEMTFNMTPPNAFGVTLSVPIWSSGKRAAGITEKKLAKQAAENTLADAEDGLKVQHKQAKYNLTSAYENFDTQKLNIDVSQRVFNSTSNKFEQGYASALELTNASMTILSAQNDYVQSVLSLVNAQIELKKLLNK